jgi:hypothetical protein
MRRHCLTSELTKLNRTRARAISIDDVNQLGRGTGQATRLRTVTRHRLFLALVSALGSGLWLPETPYALRGLRLWAFSDLPAQRVWRARHGRNQTTATQGPR